MSISKIRKVESDTYIRKDKHIPDLNETLNWIRVTFDVDPTQPFREFVEMVCLKNERGDKLDYNDGSKNEPLRGPINTPILNLCFDMDDCLLLDGATFIIVMKDRFTGEFEKHSFVLSNDKWIEGDGGSASCPA